MTLPDKINDFLRDSTDISLGYNEINFILPENFDKEQVGYRIDSAGKSLATGNEGDWEDDWLVIATDQVGDPIIVNVSSPTLAVLSAAHGEDSWEPFVIADSLDNFKNIISDLTTISNGRTSPVDIEENPITKKQKQTVLTKIKKINPDSAIWYWESFLDND